MGTHVVYHCQWCLFVRDREKKIKTGDGQMTQGACGSYLERILKHSWMSHLGWFQIQSTECWHVCYWIFFGCGVFWHRYAWSMAFYCSFCHLWGLLTVHILDKCYEDETNNAPVMCMFINMVCVKIFWLCILVTRPRWWSTTGVCFRHLRSAQVSECLRQR